MALKYLGTKVVQLDTVKLPAGHAKRKKEAHVKDLAQSIERSGVIALPVVRVNKDRSKELIAGGDRFAALQILGFKKHEVRLVQGTDEEMEVLTIEENLTRRRSDDYSKLAARLVELTTEKKEEEKANEEPAAEPEKRKPGRPKSTKGEAREEVAAQLGKTPEALRAAEKRAKKEKERPTLEEANASPFAKPPVDTFDLELAESVVRDEFPSIRVVQESLRDAGRKVDGALRVLTLNLKFGPGESKRAYDHTYDQVHAAADAIRRATPTSVCPWCKCDLALRKKCSGCGQTGFVSEPTLEGVAPELLKRGAEAMVTDGAGGFLSMVVLRQMEGRGHRKPAKGARKMRIENEHGEDIGPTADESQAAPEADPFA